jgi:chaperonin cofactor prefoldin
MSEQMQQEVRRRHEVLQRESKALEERRQRVVEGLRDLSAQLQDALVEPARQGREEESLTDALDFERRR